MLKNREREIEKRLVKKVKRLGGTAYKFVSPENDGMPDRLVVWPNLGAVFVEVKRPGEKPRALQYAQMRKLRALGQVVLWLDSVDEIEQLELISNPALSDLPEYVRGLPRDSLFKYEHILWFWEYARARANRLAGIGDTHG